MSILHSDNQGLRKQGVLMCSLGERTGCHSEWNRTLIIYIDFTTVHGPFYVNNAATNGSFVVISTSFKQRSYRSGS